MKGHYVLIGLKKDPVFGHVIAVGVGGIYAELLKDVAFRVCPITLHDAQEMVDELKLKELLTGFRGHPPANLPFLRNVIVDVSRLPLKHPEIEEMDIKPFVINEYTGVAVDARMVVS